MKIIKRLFKIVDTAVRFTQWCCGFAILSYALCTVVFAIDINERVGEGKDALRAYVVHIYDAYVSGGIREIDNGWRIYKDTTTQKWVLQIDAIRLNGMDSTDEAPADEGIFVYLKGSESLSQRYDGQWHTTDSYLLADLPSDVTPDVALSERVLETGLYK